MTFSARPRTSVRALLAPFALGALLVALGTAGCENKHIGRTCDLNADAGTTSGSGSTATINPEALECPSRICILPPSAGGATDTTSLCTADCSSDDDCSDAETGPKNPPASTTDHHCENGFVCTIATTVGDFCCRKFCLCKDFTGPGPFTTPKICEAGNNSTCKNVPP
jgi:hypothetical protein